MLIMNKYDKKLKCSFAFFVDLPQLHVTYACLFFFLEKWSQQFNICKLKKLPISYALEGFNADKNSQCIAFLYQFSRTSDNFHSLFKLFL